MCVPGFKIIQPFVLSSNSLKTERSAVIRGSQHQNRRVTEQRRSNGDDRGVEGKGDDMGGGAEALRAPSSVDSKPVRQPSPDPSLFRENYFSSLSVLLSGTEVLNLWVVTTLEIQQPFHYG